MYGTHFHIMVNKIPNRPVHHILKTFTAIRLPRTYIVKTLYFPNLTILKIKVNYPYINIYLTFRKQKIIQRSTTYLS